MENGEYNAMHDLLTGNKEKADAAYNHLNWLYELQDKTDHPLSKETNEIMQSHRADLQSHLYLLKPFFSLFYTVNLTNIQRLDQLKSICDNLLGFNFNTFNEQLRDFFSEKLFSNRSTKQAAGSGYGLKKARKDVRASDSPIATLIEEIAHKILVQIGFVAEKKGPTTEAEKIKKQKEYIMMHLREIFMNSMMRSTYPFLAISSVKRDQLYTFFFDLQTCLIEHSTAETDEDADQALDTSSFNAFMKKHAKLIFNLDDFFEHNQPDSDLNAAGGSAASADASPPPTPSNPILIADNLKSARTAGKEIRYALLEIFKEYNMNNGSTRTQSPTAISDLTTQSYYPPSSPPRQKKPADNPPGAPKQNPMPPPPVPALPIAAPAPLPPAALFPAAPAPLPPAALFPAAPAYIAAAFQALPILNPAALQQPPPADPPAPAA
jgi:hypothetical protein